jgi:hypothetical protein
MKILSSIDMIIGAGIDYADAVALRRASMTLHRWNEAECGDSTGRASYSLERDEDTGLCYRSVWYHDRLKAIRYRVADRETGARRRAAKILKKYGFEPYFQTDPRGCALWIIRPGDVPVGENAAAFYTRGVPVY